MGGGRRSATESERVLNVHLRCSGAGGRDRRDGVPATIKIFLLRLIAELNDDG